MSITKPAVLPPWADTAVPTTDIVQPPNGFISAGWPLSSVPPSRQYFNWAMNYAANGIRYFSRRGIADYDAAETYLPNDIVRGDDNALYQSSVGANTGNAPSSSTAQWTSLNLYPRTNIEAAAGVVPTDTRYPFGNVMRYGALGDDTHDDTAAIQTALNLVSWAGAVGRGNVVGRVFLPACAAYKITSTLYIGPNTIVEGEGAQSSLLDYTGSGVAVASLYALNVGSMARMTMGRIGIYCSGSAQIGLLISGGSVQRFEDMSISGNVTHAMAINQSELVLVRNVTFSPLLTTSVSGVWIVNGPDISPGLTFTAPLTSGALFGTLTSNWAGSSGIYVIQFVETSGSAPEERLVQLTNGSASASWSPALVANCNATTTAALSGYTNRLQFNGCNFNPNSTIANGINDDGGAAHSFVDCNSSGGVAWMRAAGVYGLRIVGCETEISGSAQIQLRDTTMGGSYVGPCSGGEISSNVLYGGFGIANLVDIGAASSMAFRNNSGGGFTGSMFKLSTNIVTGCEFADNDKAIIGIGRTTAPFFDSASHSSAAYANNAIRQVAMTFVASALGATGAQTITPASMEFIVNGSTLLCLNADGTNAERVTVSSTTGTTFTATFLSTKTANWTIRGSRT